MTLSRLELGFESPWGRHLHQTGDTVECRDCREGPKIKGSRFFVAFFLNWYGFRRKGASFSYWIKLPSSPNGSLFDTPIPLQSQIFHSFPTTQRPLGKRL